VPARRTTSVAGTPEFSHSDTAARRRSYGPRAQWERHHTSVSAVLQASANTALQAES
jgi:hypothetical protein